MFAKFVDLYKEPDLKIYILPINFSHVYCIYFLFHLCYFFFPSACFGVSFSFLIFQLFKVES